MKQKPLGTFYEKWMSSKDILSKISKPIPVECDSGILAVSSDYHIGNKMFAFREYNSFCKTALELNAVHMIAGDVIDGICMHSISHNEVFERDPVSQIGLAKRTIKDDGTTKYVLGGNHENFAGKYNGDGTNLCEMLCEGRGDMVYCGDFYARLDVNGKMIDLCHLKGLRSGSYEVMIGNFMKKIGNVPDLMANGHYHEQVLCIPEGVKSIIGGGFKNFRNSRKKGGWIVDTNEDVLDVYSIIY